MAGWGGGALGPVFVGRASQYGGKATEVENMSEAIAWCGAAYVAAAALVIATIWFRTRQEKRRPLV